MTRDDALADLVDDDEFWRRQAQGLAVFATGDHLWTHRMPYSVTEQRTRVAVTSHFSREAGVRAVADLVAAGTSFDSLFCCNDLLALGAMEELRHRWISSVESRIESRTQS